MEKKGSKPRGNGTGMLASPLGHSKKECRDAAAPAGSLASPQHRPNSRADQVNGETLDFATPCW